MRSQWQQVRWLDSNRHATGHTSCLIEGYAIGWQVHGQSSLRAGDDLVGVPVVQIPILLPPSFYHGRGHVAASAYNDDHTIVWLNLSSKGFVKTAAIAESQVDAASQLYERFLIVCESPASHCGFCIAEDYTP